MSKNKKKYITVYTLFVCYITGWLNRRTYYVLLLIMVCVFVLSSINPDAIQLKSKMVFVL